MDRVIGLLRRNREVLLYLLFGVLTTAVSYLVYFPCYNFLGLGGAVSNGISWVCAVAFAFLTNKPFVFKSHDWSARTLWPELIKFVGCRVGSGAAETAILFLAVDWLKGDGNLWKVITSVLVVLLNYLGSKLLVFRKPSR